MIAAMRPSYRPNMSFTSFFEKLRIVCDFSGALIECAAEQFGDDPGALHGRSSAGESPSVRIPVQPFDSEFLGVPVTAVQLDGRVRHALGHLVCRALRE